MRSTGWTWSSALKADPKATAALAQSLSSHAKSSPGYFAEVRAS